MNYLDDHDFDEDAERFARQNPAPEPEEKEDPIFNGGGDPQARDSGSSSLGSGKISLKGSQSNSANVYGSTLGGDGINPFG